jgi:hypothetical protein
LLFKNLFVHCQYSIKCLIAINFEKILCLRLPL